MGMTKIDTKLRHEWKHRISHSDMAEIISRLSLIMSDDPHYGREPYHIRSLYFDNIYDKALQERMNGREVREKFRIRYYNRDPDYIVLEKKCKFNQMCGKLSTMVTYEQARDIIEGNYEWLQKSDDGLCRELYAKIRAQLLKPRVIVDYTRKAFVYPIGNVRITLDYNIRTGLDNIQMFDDIVTVPADLTDPVILEVKYDEFLPSLIRDAVQLDRRFTASFSKYAACRLTNF